ncbi:MAG TPA: hypothetical protein VHN14_36305 [Kofleriaceae bacterium]|jgi:hypothetical protein|nr:hypothetical protein [Kofleriaceae bacterium]
MAVFELGGALAPAIPELLIGPWTCAPPSFAAEGAGTDPPASLWRIELVRDDAASRAALAAGEHSVARTHAVLDEVPRRLDRAFGRALAEIATLAEPAALTHPARSDPARGDRGRAPTRELSPAEADLVAALLTGHADPPPRPDAPADALADAPADALDLPGDPTRTSGGLERTLDHIADLARGRARIETHLEGALVASSIMTLSGDTDLWVTPRLSPAGAGLHARSVAIAVRTRHAWARVLTMIVAGVGRLMAFGLPAAGVAALPLVWRFLRNILHAVRARNAVPHLVR